MKCPMCKESNLVMTDRQGIEIDYCPECRGIWLDRGELDKLVERAERPTSEQARGNSHERHERHDGHEQHDGHYRDNEYRGKPRKSFLRDLFD